MEIQQLRCFAAVADHGSFTKAAAAVHVTQPALSHAIAKLESELGVRLFNRAATGARVTSAGSMLLERARQALWAIEGVESAAASLHGVLAGTLRIVSSRSFTTPFSALAAEFHALHPLVNLQISSPLAEFDVCSLVSLGECDVALAGMVELPPGLAAQVLDEEALAVVLPEGSDLIGSGHTASWEQVSMLPLILPPTGNPARLGIDRIFAEFDLTVSATVENEDYESTIELVRLGVGACLAKSSFSRLPAGLQVKTITPMRRTQVGLIYRRGDLAPAAAAFRDLAVSYYAASRRRGPG
ncbi:LysR family transcriptional regulator [Tomitella biformata]|uniref:LysR family transcriptional regulator n=1 Tax=Tomitella biformata TaxID=630403 RepID=UPI00046743A1|nr:LysR family transcriptional regulator [Tomitella biformata]